MVPSSAAAGRGEALGGICPEPTGDVASENRWFEDLFRIFLMVKEKALGCVDPRSFPCRPQGPGRLTCVLSEARSPRAGHGFVDTNYTGQHSTAHCPQARVCLGVTPPGCIPSP